jgi:2-dehydro-3-deoxyphosphogluconate aldolase / (4S)-4-hydroxy-2-oxoglutarate aldolase
MLFMSDQRPEIPLRLHACRIVAILRRTDATAAVATAEALLAGGIDALEVTCDSPGVLDMIRSIDSAFADRVLLGAGTVLDAQTAQAALEAGAKFLVSPHTDAALVRQFTSRGTMWIPGAFTASEVLTAWRAGASIVKLFPAGSVGPAYVKDVRGPLREIPLLPTGGVTIDNARSFLDAGAWGLGMGSALVDPKLVLDGRFDELETRARRLRQIVDSRATATT